MRYLGVFFHTDAALSFLGWEYSMFGFLTRYSLQSEQLKHGLSPPCSVIGISWWDASTVPNLTLYLPALFLRLCVPLGALAHTTAHWGLCALPLPADPSGKESSTNSQHLVRWLQSYCSSFPKAAPLATYLLLKRYVCVPISHWSNLPRVEQQQFLVNKLVIFWPYNLLGCVSCLLIRHVIKTFICN